MEAGRRSCQNVAKSFHNNWFVFVLRREYTNMASGLERHVSVWLTKHCSTHRALHRPLSRCVSVWSFPLDVLIWQDLMQLFTTCYISVTCLYWFLHSLPPHGLFGGSIINNSCHACKQRSNFPNYFKVEIPRFPKIPRPNPNSPLGVLPLVLKCPWLGIDLWEQSYKGYYTSAFDSMCDTVSLRCWKKWIQNILYMCVMT